MSRRCRDSGGMLECDILSMTIKLELSSDAENRLKDRAQTVGVPPEEYAAKLLEETLQEEARKPTPLEELLAQWDREDATTDPQELQARQEQWEVLQKALNES